MSDVPCTKIGFIGFGNMAQAIASGLLRAQAVPAGNIYACAKNFDKLQANAAKFGINACASAEDVVEASDVVFIAVKPYLVDEVCEPIADDLASKIVISVAVNMPFGEYEQVLVPGTHHISTLPNTPVQVNEGVWVCESTHSLTDEDMAVVRPILEATGIMVFVDAKLMGVAGTVTGCGPAFVAMFMEALGDAAVKYGVPRATAYQLAGQMITGTGKMAVETGAHPAVLKDAVCSPGGTTIKGVARLEECGLRNSAIQAIDAIMQAK
jgi:pyrroline-5-carboxylate reductase